MWWQLLQLIILNMILIKHKLRQPLLDLLGQLAQLRLTAISQPVPMQLVAANQLLVPHGVGVHALVLEVLLGGQR